MQQEIKAKNNKRNNNKKNNIPFDIAEAIRSGTFISGMPGSGKSNLAKYLVKKLLEAGIRVYILDPSDAWVEEGPIKQVVEIKKNNLTPILPAESTIFDIKLLLENEQEIFAEHVCRTLFFEHAYLDKSLRKPTVCVFEEAQIYLPEGISRAKRAAEIKRVATLGRNFKLRIFIITQFAANVDKLFVKACGQKYIGYTDEPNDWNYLEDWINEDKTKLAELEIGEFFYRYKKDLRRIQTPEYKDPDKPVRIETNLQTEDRPAGWEVYIKKEKIKSIARGLGIGFLFGFATALFMVIIVTWRQ